MSEESKPLQVDLDQVIREKNPALARLLPRFVLAYLRRTIHEEEINRVLCDYSHLAPVPFIRATLADMGISYRAVGLDHLPREGRYLFASNHPFGGMDGMMLCAELAQYFPEVRIIVNDLLMHLRPLAPLFIPVNKHGRQSGPYMQQFREAMASSVQVATFPAGLCSRRKGGQIRDLGWKPSFVKHAIETQRDVVPVFFEGRLSSFFYNLSNLRKMLGIQANIEMLYLPDQMFAQRGRHFDILFGDPIPWQTLNNGERPAVWASRIRQYVYRLKSDVK